MLCTDQIPEEFEILFGSEKIYSIDEIKIEEPTA